MTTEDDVLMDEIQTEINYILKTIGNDRVAAIGMLLYIGLNQEQANKCFDKYQKQLEQNKKSIIFDEE